ncbi:MAG TPA: rhomboid family intramembrane serine protease [Ktedonobacteraceae bacterium]|nr:rhomboid family intramembrane serine protease [Ktedonobacteraceae bacterium]
MEAQTNLQSYLEQGRLALAQGQAREAAIAYAHAAQVEPNDPAVHLGLAEANLALSDYAIVRMACNKVFELQSHSGIEAKLAQALLDLLDHRYERALQNVDAVISEDPSIAYVHALRSYLLRANGQDYDANLARARATRLSYGGRFDKCFPALEPPPPPSHDSATQEQPYNRQNGGKLSERENIPSWSRLNAGRRQMIRTRFFLNQNPGFVTNVIIAINIVLYLLVQIVPSLYFILGYPVIPGEYWRLVTGIFLYRPGDMGSTLLPFAIGMLSLFFIGRGVEIFYGQVRYVAIYLLSAISSSIICYLLFGIGLFPGGAIFGIFGAIGVFYIANRRSLGTFGTSAIMNWVFWLILNLALASSNGTGAVILELICLGVSMVVAFFLLPRSKGRTMP